MTRYNDETETASAPILEGLIITECRPPLWGPFEPEVDLLTAENANILYRQALQWRYVRTALR